MAILEYCTFDFRTNFVPNQLCFEMRYSFEYTDRDIRASELEGRNQLLDFTEHFSYIGSYILR